MLWVVDNHLLDHVGLPQVVIVAVHLDGWPVKLYCHLLGLDSHPHPQSQSQSLDNNWSRSWNKLTSKDFVIHVVG